jgi:hypothetical protein
MDASIRQTDRIVGKALIGAEALFADLRVKIVDSLYRQFGSVPNEWLLQATRSAIARTTPLLIDHMSDSELAGWIGGIDNLSRQFPSWVWEEFQTGIRQPPSPPSFRLSNLFNDQPKLRFPLIEEAAKRLAHRNAFTREQWDAASDEARKKAYMITGDLTEDTIGRVRDMLSSDLDEGTSLRSFKARLGDVLEKSGLGPARVETIYRTNVQGAFRDGRETLATDPIVSELFPYQAYLPIEDARTRATHLQLGKLGLNGTGIYRRDDPFWDLFTPPWDYNCRCGVRLMTIASAARAGVMEAQEWLDTGVAPRQPEWRFERIPFPANEGWGSRGYVVAI